MKKHRNILYALVFFLLVLNLVTFIVMSSRLSNFQMNIDKNREEVKNNTQLIMHFVKTTEEQNQKNFQDLTFAIQEISSDVFTQKESIENQISQIKSNQGDFTDIASSAVKSIVTVRTDSSMGTGFLVDSSGYIATNYHILANARQLFVMTFDQKIIPASLVGFDIAKDIAVLKLEGKFESLELADSDKVQVGNKVIAIGNPLGLSFTVTEGIVSALDRTGPNGLPDYIQTDVSLNPGNSGGPLINLEGEVIGINNFKLGDAENLGFALESNELKKTLNDLVNKTII